MIGFLVVLAVLSLASVAFNFFTLACAGRLVNEQREAVDAFIAGHNIVANRVTALGETLDSAIDCLLTLDASAADTSAEVDAAG